MRIKSANTRNIESYREIHEHDPRYGRSSQSLKKPIETAVIAGIGSTSGWVPATILDFGCGKSTVAKKVAQSFGMVPFFYDPAIPQYSDLPVGKADLVINTDVLEHLDESEIDLVLGDISQLSQSAFFNISTRTAKKLLPNGENAHATVRPVQFWQERLQKHFTEVIDLSFQSDAATFVTWQISDNKRRIVLAALSGNAMAVAQIKLLLWIYRLQRFFRLK